MAIQFPRRGGPPSARLFGSSVIESFGGTRPRDESHLRVWESHSHERMGIFCVFMDSMLIELSSINWASPKIPEMCKTNNFQSPGLMLDASENKSWAYTERTAAINVLRIFTNCVGALKTTFKKVDRF